MSNHKFTDSLDYKEFSGFSIQKSRAIKTYFGPYWDGPRNLVKKRGFQSKNGRLEMMMRLLVGGKSQAEVRRRCGGSSITVFRVYKFLVALNGPFYCKCGRPSNHLGICKQRVTPKTLEHMAILSAMKIKLTKKVAMEIMSDYKTGKWSLRKLAKKYNVGATTAFRAVHGTLKYLLLALLALMVGR